MKVDTKAIQSIGMSVITHNPRIRVNHEYNKWNLHISDVQLEDAGMYMCQLNTEPMIHQVRVCIKKPMNQTTKFFRWVK